MRDKLGRFVKGYRSSPKTEFKKGYIPKNPIKKGEYRGKETQFKKGQKPSWTGKKLPFVGGFKKGKDNPMWRGGTTSERRIFYSSPKWSRTILKIWKRDNATCKRCLIRKTKNYQEFHIHHIISISNKKLRCTLSNLVLLCKKCHIFVHTKKNKNREFLEHTGIYGDVKRRA